MNPATFSKSTYQTGPSKYDILDLGLSGAIIISTRIAETDSVSQELFHAGPPISKWKKCPTVLYNVVFFRKRKDFD